MESLLHSLGYSDLKEFLHAWGYVAILIGTFLEGETIVIIAGAFAALGYMSLPLVFITAVLGTFFGDQVYFTIGKVWGTKLLMRRPKMKQKSRSVFRLLKKHETAFILSFRFIYGLRNVSPFVIGMNGIKHPKFAGLNFIAAFVWGVAFAGGGYMLGKMFKGILNDNEHVLDHIHYYIFFTIVGIVSIISLGVYIFRRIRGTRDPKILRLHRIQAIREAARLKEQEKDGKA